MRTSLSRIKKFLGPSPSIQSSPSQSHSKSQAPSQSLSPSVHTQNLTQTKRHQTLPQILCENQDLKQRVKVLEREKELLEIFVKNCQNRYSSIRMSADQRDNNGEKEKEKEREKEREALGGKMMNSVGAGSKSRSKRDSVSRSRSKRETGKDYDDEEMMSVLRTKNEGSGSKVWGSSSKMGIEQRLEQQQQKNRMLNNKVMRLNVLLENQQKQKKQMLEIIEQLRKKLQESTEHILKIQREPIKTPPQPQPQPQPQSPHSLNQPIPNPQPTLTSHLQILQQKLSNYYQTKNQNYHLRDKIAQLLFTNQILQEKVIGSSKVIQHLWKIKEIQMENLGECLKEMRVD